jgi:hypothetical protein
MQTCNRQVFNFLFFYLPFLSLPGTGVVRAALCLELLDDGLPEGLILLICPLSQQEIISLKYKWTFYILSLYISTHIHNKGTALFLR